jgi:hypothetical protein
MRPIFIGLGRSLRANDSRHRTELRHALQVRYSSLRAGTTQGFFLRFSGVVADSSALLPASADGASRARALRGVRQVQGGGPSRLRPVRAVDPQPFRRSCQLPSRSPSNRRSMSVGGSSISLNLVPLGASTSLGAFNSCPPDSHGTSAQPFKRRRIGAAEAQRYAGTVVHASEATYRALTAVGLGQQAVTTEVDESNSFAQRGISAPSPYVDFPVTDAASGNSREVGQEDSIVRSQDGLAGGFIAASSSGANGITARPFAYGSSGGSAVDGALTSRGPFRARYAGTVVHASESAFHELTATGRGQHAVGQDITIVCAQGASTTASSSTSPVGVLPISTRSSVCGLNGVVAEGADPPSREPISARPFLRRGLTAEGLRDASSLSGAAVVTASDGAQCGSAAAPIAPCASVDAGSRADAGTPLLRRTTPSAAGGGASARLRNQAAGTPP